MARVFLCPRAGQGERHLRRRPAGLPRRGRGGRLPRRGRRSTRRGPDAFGRTAGHHPAAPLSPEPGTPGRGRDVCPPPIRVVSSLETQSLSRGRHAGRPARSWAPVLRNEGVEPMGRGRAKAKQTRVARELKYSSPNTDLSALQRELAGSTTSYTPHQAKDDDEDDEYSDRWADDDADDDDWATSR